MKKRIIKLITAFIILINVVSFQVASEPVSDISYLQFDGDIPLSKGIYYIPSGEEVIIASDKTLIIPTGCVLNVESGANLTIKGNCTLNGDIMVSLGGFLQVDSKSFDIKSSAIFRLAGSAEFSNSDGVLKNSGEIRILDNGALKTFCNVGSSGKIINYGYAGFFGNFTPEGEYVDNIYAKTIIAGNAVQSKSGFFKIVGSLGVDKKASFSYGGTLHLGKISLCSFTGQVKKVGDGVLIDEREKPAPLNPADILSAEPYTEIPGIDVSWAQGNIDWEKTSKDPQARYTYIRAARGALDSERPIAADGWFDINYKGAKAGGLKVGVYFYSYASTVKEARAEAEFLVNLLKDYDIDLPIWYDVEDAVNVINGNDVYNEMIMVFCDTLLAAGYFPMIYSYQAFLASHIYPETYAKYPIMIAAYQSKVNTVKPHFNGVWYGWQYSCKGKVAGINGDVDLDIFYRDLEAIVKKYGFNGKQI